MAGMISKFHNLIQSKVLWMVFVGIVVFGFVLLPVASNLSGRKDRRRTVPGTINGKPVSIEEYSSARMQTYLSLMLMSLMYGRELEDNAQIRGYVDEVSWKRLITLRKAREMGFQVFTSEAANYIKNSPVFQNEGKFDARLYTMFKNNFLEPRGFNGRDFEVHVSEEVLIQKTQEMIKQIAIVPPANIEQSLRTLSDEFKLEYVKIDRDFVKGDVQTTEEDARKLFNGSPDRYAEPMQLDIKYVYFADSDYLDKTREFEESELLDYYNGHLDDYLNDDADKDAVAAVTNEVGVVAAEDGKPIVEEKPLYKPFEEVKANILKILKNAASRERAIDMANEMVYKLAPDRDGKSLDFDEVAAAENKEVLQLEPFSVLGSPDLDDGAYTVAIEANKLRKNPDEYFSDVLPCENGVYILALEERIPKIIPPFEDVKERVMADADYLNIEKALDERAKEIRSKGEAAVAEGKSFADVAGEFGLKAETLDYFMLMNAKTSLPDSFDFQVLSQSVADLNAGEFLDVLQMGEGRLIAYVVDRRTGPSEKRIEMRDIIIRGLREDYVSKLYDTWQEYLLVSSKFEYTGAKKEIVEEAETEDDG